MIIIASDDIQPGDQVTYRATNGELMGGAIGKVLGIFRTQDGTTLADVEWERLGPPKRLSLERLIKIRVTVDSQAVR